MTNGIELTTWVPAPIQTYWGDGMYCATIGLDKDSTMTIYCYVDDIPKVIPALKRFIKEEENE